MRYILDNEGYVLYASINELISCDSKECTEYKGELPNGYETIEEWFINANIRAYKIVDGNLVFDSTRDAELRLKWELEASINTPATIGYVNEKFNQATSIYDETLSKTTNELKIEDAGNYEIPEIIIKSKEGNINFPNGIKLQVSNENLLVNTGITETINGLTFTPNSDGTIKIKGTATADTEYVVGGSMENTTPIFMFDAVNTLNEDIPMWICPILCLIDGTYSENSIIRSRLYANDGENRELVVEGSIATLTENKYITCATIFVSSGSTINATYGLDVKKQDTTGTYIQGKTSEVIDINVHKLESDQFIKIDGEYIKLVKEEDEEIIQSIKPLTSYENYTLIQCSEDVSIETTYRTPIKLAGFDITSDGFTTEIFSKYDYTQEDLDKVNNYLVDLGTLTEDEMIKYDLSGDGKIMSNDALMMRYLIDNGITTKNSLKFSINNKEQVNKYNFLSIINGNGETLTNIGSRGITTNGLEVKGIDILDRFSNVNLNNKTEVGINDSQHLYFRGSVSDHLQYQLNCIPDGRLLFQKCEDGVWSNLWGKGPFVNDVIVTYSDTNPSANYGGTWSCVDIEMTPSTISNPFTLNTTNTTSASVSATRLGHFIFVQYQFVPKVALTDTSVEVLTFNLSSLGVTSFNNIINHVAFTDGGNCSAFINVAKNGLMTCLDIIPDNSISAGQTVFGSFVAPIAIGHMTARGKRYWRRTA